jgi:ATP-dependent protease ClpP protease subunit
MKKLTKTTIAAVAIAASVVTAFNTVKLDEEILVNGEFNATLFEKVHDNLLDDNRYVRHTLWITSPGGHISALSDIEATIENNDLNVDTYVKSYAASAAAITFLSGTNRMIDENGVLVFHRARVMIDKTTPLLASLVDYMLAHDALPDDLQEDIRLGYKKLIGDGSPRNLALVLIFKFGRYIENLKKIDNRFIEKAMEITGRNREFVEKNIIHPYNDKYIYAEEAVKYRIATNIGHQTILEKYKAIANNYLVKALAVLGNNTIETAEF